MSDRDDSSVSPGDDVETKIQRQPHLYLRLIQNSLTVAESLRRNYFKNTAEFVRLLRSKIRQTGETFFSAIDVTGLDWLDMRDEVVTFIDGGVGEVRIASQVPLLLRVGSYRVKLGEQRLSEREQFGYYPIILGDLQGGSKERKDYIDIVRITAELLGGLSALVRTPDLRLLMFHGPLVYHVGAYAGHSPFTSHDIDLFLHQYTTDSALAQQLKSGFLEEARVHIYPQMTDRPDEWVRRELFEPLAWMAFLYRQLIHVAEQRSPSVIIAGVVERTPSREFIESQLLERVFRGLRQKNNVDYFNRIYGRTDLTSPKALLDKLGYTDTLLLAMLLDPGQMSEPWEVDKYSGLREGNLTLPGDPTREIVRFSPLKPSVDESEITKPIVGFPRVQGSYVHVSETTEPIRIETFSELGNDQLKECALRAYRYARLLPGYGFPVGLDIVDKYAHVPEWMTNAYGKLIRLHLAESLQRGEINDKHMRKIIIEAIYMTHRDWLFRPQVQ
jgi:hypothetical protein